MKYFILCILLVNSTVIFSQNDTLLKKLELTFEDTFDNDSMLHVNWNFEYPWGRTLWSAKAVELEWYSDSNVFVKDTILQLVAKKQKTLNQTVRWFPQDTILGDGIPNYREFEYTSGIIYSKQKFGYGYYEIRCRLPKGEGFWPCFWIWSPQGEIDVCEPNGKLSKKAKKYGATIHAANGRSGKTIKIRKGYSKDFNTYAIVWEPNQITWMCNNKIVRIYNDTLKIPKCEMAIIANFAIDPYYKPNSKTIFPQSFDIDYIRYYRIKD